MLRGIDVTNGLFTGETKTEYMEFLKNGIEKFEEHYGADHLQPLLDDEESTLSIPYEIKIDMTKKWQHKSAVKWLGPPPIAKERIYACFNEIFDSDLDLIDQCALVGGHSELVYYLFQNGYNMNRRDADGTLRIAMFFQHHFEKNIKSIKTFLEWGLEKDDIFEGFSRAAGSTELAGLFKYPLGGRRCEIQGLKSRGDLNGLTGVAGKYLAKEERYIFTVGELGKGGKPIQVRPSNLKRRDRTVDDPGYVYKWNDKKGKLIAEIQPRSSSAQDGS